MLVRFLVVFALTCLGVAVAYFSVFHSRTREFSDSVRYVLEGAPSYTANAADAYYNGVLYTNFTKLAEYLELPVTGTIHYTRFLLPDPDNPVPSAEGSGMEESVLFAVGSFTANINGENVDMAGPCRLTGTQLWVPLSFVESYLSGVTVERLDADNVKLSRTPVEGSDPKAKNPEREALSFRVKPQFPIAPIVWDEE